MHVCSIMTKYSLLESSAHKLHYFLRSIFPAEIYFYACIYSFREYIRRTCSVMCQAELSLSRADTAMSKTAVSSGLGSGGLMGMIVK